MHIIPRYAKPHVFEGKKFADAKWGDFYFPYDKDFKISERITNKIAGTIKKEMQKI